MDIDHPAPWPAKRQKPNSPSPETQFSALPLPLLLLSLSNLLLHPPTHRHFPKSVYLSFLSALGCLEGGSLDVDVECRAWTAVAEVGMRMGIGGVGVEGQVESAVTQGVRPSTWSSSLHTEQDITSAIAKCIFGLLHAKDCAPWRGATQRT